MTEKAQNENVRRRFGAALELKRNRARARAAHQDAQAKVDHASGPATQQTPYRRKTG